MGIRITFIAGFCLAAISILTSCASHRQAPAAKISIPPIAAIANIQVGFSTQEELARQWGEGKTTAGSHPNSGREWRVKGTAWRVATDGFEYSERGLVIDGLRFSADLEKAGSSPEAPFARPAKEAFFWLGEIAPGMAEAGVVDFLNRHSWKYKTQGNRIELSASGFSPVASSAGFCFGQWLARLEFSDGRLSCLVLAADLEREKHSVGAK